MALRFEWDAHKNRANQAKHGVGFEEASRVFSDPLLIMREDRVVDGEQRWHALGSVGSVLLVVHTVREDGLDDVIRVISARKATRAERLLYEETD
jgi:uncharacterized protein